MNKDYLADVYKDFFETPLVSEKQVEETTEQTSFPLEDVEKLLIDEDSKDLLKKIFEYMRKYHDKEEERYLDFHFVLESDNDETIYYEESSKARLRFIRTCLDKAISASSKEGFVKMVEYINNSDSSFWSEIGWNSWKRFLYGNYYYMKFFPRIKCKIKRIIG